MHFVLFFEKRLNFFFLLRKLIFFNKSLYIIPRTIVDQGNGFCGTKAQ